MIYNPPPNEGRKGEGMEKCLKTSSGYHIYKTLKVYLYDLDSDYQDMINELDEDDIAKTKDDNLLLSKCIACGFIKDITK